MEKYSKIILFIPFHSLLPNEVLGSERGDEEWVREREQRGKEAETKEQSVGREWEILR